MKKGSLAIVGTGIHLNHLTIEARDQIEDAEKVFFVVADPISASWILKTNRSAESLQDCYAPGKDRSVSYREMSDRIMHAVREGLQVCAVFYGHPAVFVTASHQAIKECATEGFYAKMYPAVSAEDCLYADLGIEPATGCQLFEATDFLLRSRIFDPTCSLVLFQIGIIGEMTCNPDKSDHPGLALMISHLLKFYEPSHPVVLYEASQHPTGKPGIIRCTLETIDPSTLKVITTLYVYPRAQRERNNDVLLKLGMTAKTP